MPCASYLAVWSQDTPNFHKDIFALLEGLSYIDLVDKAGQGEGAGDLRERGELGGQRSGGGA